MDMMAAENGSVDLRVAFGRRLKSPDFGLFCDDARDDDAATHAITTPFRLPDPPKLGYNEKAGRLNGRRLNAKCRLNQNRFPIIGCVWGYSAAMVPAQ
jgi:hypothetical protein